MLPAGLGPRGVDFSLAWFAILFFAAPPQFENRSASGVKCAAGFGSQRTRYAQYR
jgi:hypothetical protein